MRYSAKTYARAHGCRMKIKRVFCYKGTRVVYGESSYKNLPTVNVENLQVIGEVLSDGTY